MGFFIIHRSSNLAKGFILMYPEMKNILQVFFLICLLSGCNAPSSELPEPHLELGQRITFVGAEPEKTYVVVGYRHLLEDKTDKNWNNHDYIVFTYHNDRGDILVATIHRNAILKR